MSSDVFIHEEATEVSEDAEIASGTRVWHDAQIREGVVIGENCNIGKNVYIDFDVEIGSNVKIQNNVSVYHGVTIKDGVFVGPHVCFTNDKLPRAINRDGSVKDASDWEVSPTVVEKGVAIGANSTILNGITIGAWALIGAGSVVTKDVPRHGLVYGNPAKLQGFVCYCAATLEETREEAEAVVMRCPECEEDHAIPKKDYERLV